MRFRFTAVFIVLFVLLVVGLAATTGPAYGPAAGPVVVPDAVKPLAPGAVRLGGHVDERIRACIEHRVKAQSVDDVVKPFEERPETRLWRSEFWGKWYTSLELAYRYTQDPALAAILKNACDRLLATQTPDGYIGTYKKEAELSNWDVWGRKYVLLGLLDEYERTKDPKILTAAERQADHLMAEVGPGKKDISKLGWWGGLAAGSILEPITRLYFDSGDKKYLDFAKHIVVQWSQPGAPQLVGKGIAKTPVYDMFDKPKETPKTYGDYGMSKAYEMMSCYEGLCELYRATGEAKYFNAAKNVWNMIREKEIVIVGSGSNMERWCDGIAHEHEFLDAWMETCVTVTWMKFSYQLYRLTGNPAYLDEFEKSAYNALLGALPDDAAWWNHYMPMAGIRGAAPEQCDMHANCCVANGPRALMLIPKVAVMKNSAGIVVNLYGDSEARAELASGKTVVLVQKTQYPKDGEVEITVNPEEPAEFTLALRIPKWSEQTSLAVNEKTVAASPGTYAQLTRTWNKGDRVSLRFDFRARVVRMRNGQPFDAIVRGPIVLALDKRFYQVPEGAGGTASLATDGTGHIAIEPIADVPQNVWMLFEVPLKTADGREVPMKLCDFASAGQTWSPESVYRVWLPKELNLADPFEGVPTKLGH